ncbi:hypothetical protein LPIBR_10063 [Lacticaseibacillus paracasei]|nr:hypothetical protein LPIBR_10063 [Lacticaseibacillus paracasei]
MCSAQSYLIAVLTIMMTATIPTLTNINDHM